MREYTWQRSPLADKRTREGDVFERDDGGYVVSNRWAQKHEMKINAPGGGQAAFQIASARDLQDMTKGMYTR